MVTPRDWLSPVQVVLRSGGLALLTLIVSAASATAWGLTAAQQSVTTLYVDTATGRPGQVATSQVVVFLAPGDTLRSFEISLSFSSSVVSPEGFQLAPGWVEPDELAPTTAPSLVQVRGEKESAICASGSTCLLATVSWRVATDGTSPVVVEHAELRNDANAPLSINTAPGSVVASAQASGNGPRPGLAAPESSQTGISARDAAVGMTVVLLAGIALTAPVIAWQVRRVRSPARTTGSHQRPPEIVEQELAGAVTDYLATFETAGRIDTPVDPIYEQAARVPPPRRALNGATPSGTEPSMLPGSGRSLGKE